VGIAQGTDGYLASPLQRSILLNLSRDPNQALHLTQSVWRLSGELDAPTLEEAWRRVVARHEALRTMILWEDAERPVNRVAEAAEISIAHLSVEVTDPDEVLRGFLIEDRARGLDLSRAPAMRLALIDLEPASALFVWTYSHVLVDGWSVGLVADEVANVYAAIRSSVGPVLEHPGRYRDAIAWLERQDLTDAELFWAETLSGLTDPTPLPTDGVVRRASATNAPSWEGPSIGARATIAGSAGEQVRTAARVNGVTLGAVVQAAWAILLEEYGGSSDVVFGAIVAGRPMELDHIDSTVGMFVNALPVRAHIDPAETLSERLRAQHRSLAALLGVQHAPLAQLPGWSEIVRDRPLLLTVVNVQNQPFVESDPRAAGGVSWQHVTTEEPPQFPLEVTIIDGDDLEIMLDAQPQWFDVERVREILADLTELLSRIAATPRGALSDLLSAPLAGSERILADRVAAEAEHPIIVDGFRTTLEELEAALETHPGVRDVAMRTYTSADRPRIAAFFTSGEHTAHPDDLRRFLAVRLPRTVVPGLFVQVETIPRTADGRIDRSALPEADPQQLAVPPRNEVEEELAAVWAGVLGLEQVGVLDNFFELGGESLAAMLISTRASEALGIEVPMKLMLELQTVAGVAAALESR
jgi:acyl carrier protein